MLSKLLKSAKAVLPGLLPGLICVVLLRFAAIYEYDLLGFSKPVEVPQLEYASLVVLWGLLSLPARRWQPWFCFAVLTLAQLIAFIDVNYYRFFRELPSLYLLPTWFQADEAGQSLSSVMTFQDVYLLLPLLVFPVVAVPLGRLAREQRRSLKAAGFVVLVGVGCFITAWEQMHPVRYEQLQRRFQNRAIAGLFGIQFYHLYDLYEWGRVQIGAEGGRAVDKALVDRVIEESRRSSVEQTPFKGRYEGRDLILIQLESLQHFATEATYDGQPVMPFLQKAKEESFHFKLFDQTHLGRSADGQFMFLNSLTRPPSYETSSHPKV